MAKRKDKISKEDKHSIVYQIPCNDCTLTYIGQTSKKLNTRLDQHKNDCTNRKRLQPNKTALAHHHHSNRHNFNFDNTKILDTETHKRKRELLEACHIIKNKEKTVNKSSDTNVINNTYHTLIRKNT